MKEYNMDHELIYEGNYEGDRKNGFYRNGSGKEYRNGQLLFEGNWEKNIVNGYGVLYDDEGKVLYKGEWIKGWIGIDYGRYNPKTVVIIRKRTCRKIVPFGRYCMG